MNYSIRKANKEVFDNFDELSKYMKEKCLRSNKFKVYGFADNNMKYCFKCTGKYKSIEILYYKKTMMGKRQYSTARFRGDTRIEIITQILDLIKEVIPNY